MLPKPTSRNVITNLRRSTILILLRVHQRTLKSLSKSLLLTTCFRMKTQREITILRGQATSVTKQLTITQVAVNSMATASKLTNTILARTKHSKAIKIGREHRRTMATTTTSMTISELDTLVTERSSSRESIENPTPIKRSMSITRKAISSDNRTRDHQEDKEIDLSTFQLDGSYSSASSVSMCLSISSLVVPRRSIGLTSCRKVAASRDNRSLLQNRQCL